MVCSPSVRNQNAFVEFRLRFRSSETVSRKIKSTGFPWTLWPSPLSLFCLRGLFAAGKQQKSAATVARNVRTVASFAIRTQRREIPHGLRAVSIGSVTRMGVSSKAAIYAESNSSSARVISLIRPGKLNSRFQPRTASAFSGLPTSDRGSTGRRRLGSRLT